MANGVKVLLGTITIMALWFIWRCIALERARGSAARRPREGDLVIGFVTLFFDTLGIGAFAPTIAIFKLLRRVPDKDIPGTLNAGHALPGVIQALIFITLVTVDITTLVGMIVAAAAGSVLGVRVVSRLPIRAMQFGMGTALLIAAVLFVAKNLGWMPVGGNATGLEGGGLAFAVSMSFVLGALMMLGIGFFAPCLILLSLLGMNPLAAFPVMMGANIFPLLLGGASFVKARRYDVGAAIGLTLGGIPGVLIAAYVVKSLPIIWLSWLVVVIVLYAGIIMLLSAHSAAGAQRVGADKSREMQQGVK